MKTTSLLLLFFFTYATLQAQGDLMPQEIDNLSIRGDRAYYQGQPFTGIGFSMTGSKKTVEIVYRNGYKDGNHTEWHTSGKKKIDYQYSQGKMIDGTYKTCDEAGVIKKTETYKGGTLVKEENFKEGKKAGPTREYYNNGNLKSESNYVNGQLEGKVISYLEDNTVSNEETYQQGKRLSATAYDHNHRITQKTEYDPTGTTATGSTSYKYDYNGVLLSEMSYDDRQQLHGICYEKWEDGSIKWKRRYNHGQIEQTIEENKTDPTTSIKAVLAKNPSANIGTLHAMAPNDRNIDHWNVLIEYNLGSINDKEYLESKINELLFQFRIKHVDPNSSESLQLKMIIRNFRSSTRYVQPQNYFGVVIPGGYVTNASIDVYGEDYIQLPGSSPIRRTVSFETRKYNSADEAYRMAMDEMGYKISDLLYNLAPVRTLVTGIAEARKNGIAKTVKISGGNNIGIYKGGVIQVYDINDSFKLGGTVIGKLKVLQVSYDSAICDITDGDDEITRLLSMGKNLKALLP
ncbi:MAG TPA: hypothetical protein PLW44_00830 [Chitinophagales bacterium]|nr:hypothetical protein [Chitinophagales bacterium]